MAGKEKGFQESHPKIKELREYLRTSELSARKCSDQLYHHYLKSDKTEYNFYQRMNALLNDRLNDPTPEELSAIKRWMHVNENPHQYGRALHSIPTLKRKIDQLSKYLDSSYVNRTEAKKIIRSLRQLEPIATESI